MPKIIKRTVDAAKPQATDYFLWDTDIHGFGIRILPSGKKSYLIQYRAGGRTRRITLGRHGTITADEARTRAKKHLGAVADGKNPAEEIGTHRRSPALKDVCDRFMREHVSQRCKESTRKEYQRSIDLFVKPKLGNHKVLDITRADIAKLHHDMRDIPYQANRTLGVLSKLFNLTEIWGMRPDGSNPCRHVTKFKEEKRERFLSREEFDRLLETLDRAEYEGTESKAAINAIRLLIFTGCRLGEIQKLKWEDVRGDVLELPDTKTGARRVYLGEEAKTVLKNIERIEGNPYVITGIKDGQYLTDLQRPWRRIRKRAKLPDVRIHDLRHSFASAAIANGVSLPVIGKLLGHSQIQTTARYAHLADDPIREAANLVTKAISQQR